MSVLVFVVFLFVIVVVISATVTAGKRKAAQDRKGFVSAKYKLNEVYVSESDQSLIGFNFAAKQIVLGSRYDDNPYDIERIAAVAVVENGVALTQTNRGSQLLGAAVGGAVFGGVGAIVGGLSGSTRARARVNEIAIKVTVDDQLRPIHTVTLLRMGGNGVAASGAVARRARATSERIHAHLINAMRQVQRVSQVPMPSVATGDLERLWAMKQAGALTDEEFTAAKQRLLPGSVAGGAPAISPPIAPQAAP